MWAALEEGTGRLQTACRPQGRSRGAEGPTARSEGSSVRSRVRGSSILVSPPSLFLLVLPPSSCESSLLVLPPSSCYSPPSPSLLVLPPSLPASPSLELEPSIGFDGAPIGYGTSACELLAAETLHRGWHHLRDEVEVFWWIRAPPLGPKCYRGGGMRKGNNRGGELTGGGRSSR